MLLNIAVNVETENAAISAVDTQATENGRIYGKIPSMALSIAFAQVVENEMYGVSMKTLDEQIAYMKMDVDWYTGKVDSGKDWKDEQECCIAILDTLEKVKAYQNENPGSR